MSERFLAVGPDTGQVAVARRWARARVEEFAWPTRWRPDTGLVALVVSELLTNALRYAGGLAGLSLVFGARRLRIVVSDDSVQNPVLRRPKEGEPGGRGLGIVASVAESWGTVPTGHGKQVWADLTDTGGIHQPLPPVRAAGEPGGWNLSQDCLSCSSVITGNSSAAPVRSSRRPTWVLTPSRRTLPSCSKALLRASRRLVRKVESAKPTPVRSRTRWGW
ncbi:ATP-binding protein [Streptomyces sp. V4-01]|uniref:ATP-binding protein n=1 Tax=Actinacidiphila polyblastidii TaxID=3110430 RepID=A0ABU7P3S9_9ACTN|nr:ATP-binding protein [Streptomyces sp. V4-01]